MTRPGIATPGTPIDQADLDRADRLPAALSRAFGVALFALVLALFAGLVPLAAATRGWW